MAAVPLLSVTRLGLLHSIRSFLPTLPLPTLAIPAAIHLNIPNLLPGIWESILRAVPKKKQSHSRKRMRQLAGKALQDITALNNCPACGKIKRENMLCEPCGTSSQVVAHPSDIFSIAVNPEYAISAGGDSSIQVWSLHQPGHPLVHKFENVHSLGVHHLATNKDGGFAASAGFDGTINIWDLKTFSLVKQVAKGRSAGEVWAISLSPTGNFMAATTYNGRVCVYDVSGHGEKVREYETKGSFGMSVDISADGKLVASGHENGGVYIFNNETGKIHHSLPGLIRTVRCVAFSPGGRLLAAAGDSNIIALYDVISGEQVGNLSGHSSWIFSVSWSQTGEYILSGAFDGKVKVWSTDSKTCVATHTENDKALYGVKWIPKSSSIGEGFLTAGANGNICFYREATGS
ncbi:WD40 repeat-like protein [Choiromyces venosus 120613-1]|uniref:WD40 repeat-like protein n=1 Tax=Choiromyces venosus 120613-1 TaxID=1336337 RepID=A0A3N4J2E6_9PEZI|nr:WD40 repeat-like protein [Choiromyces venosus 120613-1]